MVENEVGKLSKTSEEILKHFKNEISGLRAGRPNPSLVENVEVECYGTKMPLGKLAAIDIQLPNVILIQPWDKNAIQSIEKAVLRANLGVSPAVDGNIVRVVLPPITEDRRKDLVKILGKKSEEAKIAFRLARDEVRKTIHQAANDKKISEDDKFRGDALLQKEVAAFNEKIDAIVKDREKEIMTV